MAAAAIGDGGRYNVDKLMAQHGDAKLTDLHVTLANCEKARVQRLRPPQGGV
jgi:hypothetical protein